jgi:hypothetical protein
LRWELDPSACVIAHSEPFDDGRDGRRAVVDCIGFFPSTGDRRKRLLRVKEWLEQAHAQYRFRKIIGDAAQYKLMAEELQSQGTYVELVPFTQSFNNRLALALREVVSERRLSLPDDEQGQGLLTELGTVRMKEVGPHIFKLENDPEVEGLDARELGPYFTVASLDDALERARSSGGGVVVEPVTIPAGQFAALADPQGAVFCLLEGEVRVQVADSDAYERWLTTKLLGDPAIARVDSRITMKVVKQQR